MRILIRESQTNTKKETKYWISALKKEFDDIQGSFHSPIVRSTGLTLFFVWDGWKFSKRYSMFAKDSRPR